jgi:hypothetical protein
MAVSYGRAGRLTAKKRRFPARAVFEAAGRGRLVAARLLLDAGVDPDRAPGMGSRGPLCHEVPISI